mgnify:CR=1 FL=1
MALQMDLIKKLREETGAGMMRVKQVLDEVKGDESKALEILKKEGLGLYTGIKMEYVNRLFSGSSL